jgi:hypothetical protein
MPGASLSPSFCSSTRAVKVRVSRSMSGRSAMTLPSKFAPGHAVARAITLEPTAIIETCASGIWAFTHTVLSPFRRKSAAPALNAEPSRTASSVTTPSSGANSVVVGWVRRVDSIARMVASGTPSTARRWRAASRIDCARCDCASSSARYSCCASIHCGACTSASRWPRRTRSSADLT